MTDTETREQILERYCNTTNPAKRRELLNQWLNAGGRQLVDDAVTAGLSTLRTDKDNGDSN